MMDVEDVVENFKLRGRWWTPWVNGEDCMYESCRDGDRLGCTVIVQYNNKNMRVRA